MCVIHNYSLKFMMIDDIFVVFGLFFDSHFFHETKLYYKIVFIWMLSLSVQYSLMVNFGISVSNSICRIAQIKSKYFNLIYTNFLIMRIRHKQKHSNYWMTWSTKFFFFTKSINFLKSNKSQVVITSVVCFVTVAKQMVNMKRKKNKFSLFTE